MKNKIIAFAAAFTLALQAVPVLGATKIVTTANDWTIVNEKTGVRSAELCEGGTNGKYGMKIVNTAESGSDVVEIENSASLSETASGEYTFEFTAKGTFDEKAVSAGVGTYTAAKKGTYIALNNKRFEKTTNDDGSTRYSFTMSYTYTAGDKIHIGAKYGCGELVVDEIAFYGSDNVNLVKNGGFETVTSTEVSLPKGDDYSVTTAYGDKYPKNVYIKTGSTVNIAWTNATGSIASVTLWEATDDGDVFIGNLDKGSNTVYQYSFDGVKTDVHHLYKMVTEFNDGTKTEYFIDGSSTPNGSVSGWRFDYNAGGNGKGFEPISAKIDENVSHSGEASVKITGSYKQVSNHYMKMMQTLDLKIGKKYKFSFWMKGENAGQMACRYAWAGWQNNTDGYFNAGSLEDGWKKYEDILDYSEARNGQDLLFIFEFNAHALWIDDVEMYELDEDGNVTGDNFVTNGGFETFTSSEAANVKSISAVGGDGCATVSWVQSGEPFATELYMKEDGKWIRIGQFGSGSQTVTVSNLENEKDYEFGVKNFSSTCLESTMATAAAHTVAPDTKVTYTLNDGGEKAVGANTISVRAENNKFDGDFNAEVIAVVRKGNLITGIETETVTLAKGENAEFDLQITTENETDTISVYAWDGFNTMKILVPNTTY